jgi:hypothetical protein
MDSSPRGVVPLIDAAEAGEARVGAKAVRLEKLAQAGFRVPPGVCISTLWYEEFVRHNRLTDDIQFELGRKPLSGMHWEAIWDAALRVRSRFLAGRLPRENCRCASGNDGQATQRPAAGREVSGSWRGPSGRFHETPGEADRVTADGYPGIVAVGDAECDWVGITLQAHAQTLPGVRRSRPLQCRLRNIPLPLKPERLQPEVAGEQPFACHFRP